MLGWVLLMPQCPPPPHLNYSQTSQKLGQIRLPGKKKKKKNIMAMVPNKESGRHTVGKQSQELKFDTEDLLELKFGRLLGESRETTLAKVIGRKTNPDASYVEIEKPSWKKNLETKVHEAGLPQETDFSRLLGEEERSGTSQQSSTVIGKGKAAKATTTSDLPSLAPPPSRSTTMGTSTTTTQGTAVKSGPTPHTKRAAVPTVTFGPGGYTATQGRKVKESEDDDNNYMGLVRKPKLSSQDSYKPSWPTTKIIPPMMLHKVDQYDTVDSSGGGSNDDALLRRPTAVLDHNVSSMSKPSLQGTSEISSKIKNVSPKLASVAPLRKPSVGLPATGVGSMMSPPVIEEEGRVQGSEMSEERFTHLLELASSPNDSRDQEQQVSVAAKVSTRKEKNLPILGSKPLPLSPSHVERESKDAAADQISRVDKRVGTHLLITTEAASMEVESLSQSIDLDVLESGDKRRREPTAATAATAATSVVEASLPRTTTSKRPLPSSSLDQIHVSSPISSSVDNTVAEQDITPLQSSMSSPSVTAKHVLTSPSVSANMVSEEVVMAPLKKAAADSLVLNSVPEVTVMSAKEEKGREPTVSPLGMQAIMPITAPPTPVLAQKPFVRRPTATTAVPGDAVSKSTPPSEADSSSSPSLGQPEIQLSQEETRRETTFGQSLEEEEEVESQVLKQPMPTTTLAQKPISRRASFVAMDAKPELQASSGSLKRPILQLRTKKSYPTAPPATPAAAAAAPPPPPSTGVFESELSGEEERLPDQTMISDEVNEKLNLSTSVTVVPKNAIGDKAVVADKDRLAGWSDEVKAAVRRSEVALVKEERRTPSSELNLKHLGQEDKSKIDDLLRQPIAPSPALTGASLTDPLILTRQQLLQTRPMPSSPKPSMKMTSNEDSSSNKKLQEAGFVLSNQTRVPSKEEEDRDWLRAEALLESSAVEEMLFFGANAGGMLVSFRSLVGFLPAWELSAQRRPPSFRTWAMDKGFTLKEPKFAETFIPDASLSRVELPMGSRAIVGSETSKRTQESSIRVEDDNQRNLLKQYREERRNALSKLIGETARVVVIGLDRERRRLRLSEKAAEGEGQELTQKKANVMEGLNVGDVVCCTVKKVTSYGAFVEVQGVPALIHISELSWNRIVDPTTVVAVGQELEAKVCRLDRFMQRINLSLKQMQVDPLRETLESLLDSTDMELETVDMAVEIDAKVQEIPEVNGVIKRLEQIKGIDSVVKGRCLQGMAMAPSFQVYLSGQLSNGYKLIARSGNQVQEVLVLTSLDRESAKQVILQCTMCDD